MHYIHLILLYYFLLILNSAREHPTKNLYFSKHISISTIYLLQEQRLNPKTYYNQELIMEIFVCTTGNDMNMLAKIQSIIKYIYL
jgi:hypothetical protein